MAAERGQELRRKRKENDGQLKTMHQTLYISCQQPIILVNFGWINESCSAQSEQVLIFKSKLFFILRSSPAPVTPCFFLESSSNFFINALHLCFVNTFFST